MVKVADTCFPTLRERLTAVEYERFLIILRQVSMIHEHPTCKLFQSEETIITDRDVLRGPAHKYSTKAVDKFLKAAPECAFLVA